MTHGKWESQEEIRIYFPTFELKWNADGRSVLHFRDVDKIEFIVFFLEASANFIHQKNFWLNGYNRKVRLKSLGSQLHVLAIVEIEFNVCDFLLAPKDW